MQWLENTSLLKFICRGVANFFSVNGRNPDLPAATQEVRPKPRTARDTKVYRSKPSLNYISENFTSATHFPMIYPMNNLNQLIKPQKNKNESEETSVIQEVQPKPRTARDTKVYRSKPSLNYISENFTSATHFPMIYPMNNLNQLIKPQKNKNESEETSVIT